MTCPPANSETYRTPVVVLTAGGTLGTIIVNGLVERLGSIVVIEEQQEKKSEILRRRVRLNGIVAAIGQAVLGVVLRACAPRYQRRLCKILQTKKLDPTPSKCVTIHRVASVNSQHCRELLRELNPDIVGVYGTRIISTKTLNCVSAPFINYHAGTNPKYRGQHPAYWARAEHDDENAGVTIHLVDDGVDTGDVLYQAHVDYTDDDTIMTYQYVQAATALPLFARAIEDGLAGGLVPKRVDLPSRQWFPPTLWRYCYVGVTRGVW
ncbi:MAG: formyl transferase [Hyphomicrobiaceae bacterium]